MKPFIFDTFIIFQLFIRRVLWVTILHNFLKKTKPQLDKSNQTNIINFSDFFRLKILDLTIYLSFIKHRELNQYIWKYILDGPSPHTQPRGSSINGHYPCILTNKAQGLTTYRFDFNTTQTEYKILLSMPRFETFSLGWMTVH
jgi:hypothetical protein